MKKTRLSQSKLKIVGHNETTINTQRLFAKNKSSNIMNKNGSCAENRILTPNRSGHDKIGNQQSETGHTNSQIRKSLLSHLQTQTSEIYEAIHKKNSNLANGSPQFYRQLKSSSNQQRMKTEQKFDSRIAMPSMLKDPNQLNLLEIIPKTLLSKATAKKQHQKKQVKDVETELREKCNPIKLKKIENTIK